MKRYYFDMRDGDGFAPGEEGLELPDIEAAQQEAALSLAPWRAMLFVSREGTLI